MALSPQTTPQRTPPSRRDAPAEPADRSAVTRPPAGEPLPLSVAADEQGLQEQLDLLVGHFEELKNQLRQSQKLASIGTTAAMLAHEFNNLFSPVVAYSRHALDTGDVALMRKALTKTLEQAETMRQMSDRLLGLARQSAAVIRSVKVREIVENALGGLCRDLSKDNITVNLQIDPDLAVRTNENQLLQVLFNMVINARQAMLGRPGRLTVDAAPTHDGRVQINVRDSGCGIPPQHLPHIFEPFFTTKKNADRPEQRGLGLGLYICCDLIEELGGAIDVASTVNAGTTFTITLPQAD